MKQDHFAECSARLPDVCMTREQNRRERIHEQLEAFAAARWSWMSGMSTMSCTPVATSTADRHSEAVSDAALQLACVLQAVKH
jgi:hypothetical protein